MEKKEKEYRGFWKQLGCILSLVVILAILAIFVIGFYLLIKGY
ncbi:hypothetical protein [Flagellimonas nanhaiensis]|nr:hypothetical protein [Allomuricauda nanhaiensis]